MGLIQAQPHYNPANSARKITITITRRFAVERFSRRKLHLRVLICLTLQILSLRAKMEVAGFVLSAYPAAILVFEQYKTGARYFGNWVQFRRKYEAFIRDMEGQQLFFEGILEDLMCGGPDPFLTGTSSKNEFLRIVNDATFTGWRNPILKERLRSRLDTRYDWCIHTIQRIYDILKELGELMN